jgi:hypothetical protein
MSSWFFVVLGLPSLVIIVLFAAVALVPHRRIRAAQRSPELPANWAVAERPLRCNRCSAGDLVHVPSVAMRPGSPSRLEAGRESLALELLICGSCGRVEWFGASPRGLAAFRPLKPPAGRG